MQARADLARADLKSAEALTFIFGEMLASTVSEQYQSCSEFSHFTLIRSASSD